MTERDIADLRELADLIERAEMKLRFMRRLRHSSTSVASAYDFLKNAWDYVDRTLAKIDDRQSVIVLPSNTRFSFEVDRTRRS